MNFLIKNETVCFASGTNKNFTISPESSVGYVYIIIFSSFDVTKQNERIKHRFKTIQLPRLTCAYALETQRTM